LRRLGEIIDSARARDLELSSCVIVPEEAPVRDVLSRMRQVSRSIALVTDEEGLTGIFTERDVLRKVVLNPETWDLPVSGFMTADPHTIAPDTSVREAIRMMNAGKFRDLPVVDEGGRVLGNLTHAAIVCYLCEFMQTEVKNLPPCPSQVPQTVEGA